MRFLLVLLGWFAGCGLLAWLATTGPSAAPFVLVVALVAPFAGGWWMVRARRRTREILSRQAQESPYDQPWVDELGNAEGLAFARTFDVNHELIEATMRADERSGVKDIEGRR